MAILAIIASITYRKNDVYNSLAFSLLIQITYNPYCIFDIGLQLSYLGVLGILLFYKDLSNKIEKTNIIKKYIDKHYGKMIKYLISLVSLSISANILIMPIILYNYNTISFTFIISNLLSAILIGPLIIVGYVSVFFNISFIYKIFDFLVKTFIEIANICGQLPFSQVFLTTPNLISIIVFYIIVGLAKYRIIYKEKRVLKKVISILLILMLISNSFNFYNENSATLLINMIDVGQGDGILIRYKNINILVDGGGESEGTYNVGKQVLLPYILDRKIRKLDYVIISHFDSDHCLGALYVMEKIKIKNILIGYQQEEYENYKKLKKIAKEKKIKVITVEPKDIISLEKMKFEFLWPVKNNLITENAINNNSLVFKLFFNDISILFTGDIEKEAELSLIDYYKNNPKKLRADILKIPHHGSNTSSIMSFIEMVNPKIALIGVGKNNKFGHPNQEVIFRLEKLSTKIYRTDLNGEINLNINKKIIINTMLN